MTKTYRRNRGRGRGRGRTHTQRGGQSPPPRDFGILMGMGGRKRTRTLRGGQDTGPARMLPQLILTGGQAAGGRKRTHTHGRGRTQRGGQDRLPRFISFMGGRKRGRGRTRGRTLRGGQVTSITQFEDRGDAQLFFEKI